MRPQNRKIHSKGRPLQQTKDYNCIYLSKQHIDLGTVALSGRHKPQSFIETKTLRLLQPLIQKNFKKMNLNTVPKMGPPGGPIFGDRMHSLVKEQKKSTFTVPFFGTVRRYQKWDRKIAKSTTKADPLQQTKDYNCIYLSNQHIDLEQGRPAHAKPDFNWLSGPRNGTWKRTCGISCLRSLAPM